jgi:putative tricarboxylic transport membrane protein
MRGITPPARSRSRSNSVSTAAAVTKAVKSEEWAKVLKARGWEDFHADADAFAAFLKADQVRVKDVLSSVGLVK